MSTNHSMEKKEKNIETQEKQNQDCVKNVQYEKRKKNIIKKKTIKTTFVSIVNIFSPFFFLVIQIKCSYFLLTNNRY